MSRSTARRAVSAGLLALAIAIPAAGEDSTPEPPKALSCLRLTQIDSSSVIDRQHIVFRMRDGRWYVNNLPYPCAGLRRDTPWLLRTSIAEVCDLDVVTVLNSIGGGFMPGASCGLGRFEPVSEADVTALKAQAKAARER